MEAAEAKAEGTRAQVREEATWSKMGYRLGGKEEEARQTLIQKEKYRQPIIMRMRKRKCEKKEYWSF